MPGDDDPAVGGDVAEFTADGMADHHGGGGQLRWHRVAVAAPADEFEDCGNAEDEYDR